MKSARSGLALTACLLVAVVRPCAAQLAPKPADPLDRIRAAAQENPQACSVVGASLCEQVAPKIIAAAEGESPLAENMRQLTSEISKGGPDAAARAVTWAVGAFRGSGLEARTEKYSIPVTWSRGAARLEILSPSRFSANVISVGWTPATPPTGVESNLVFAGNGTDADFARLGASAKGAFVLIRSGAFNTWPQLFEEYERTPAVVHRAAMAGAAAILWMSTRERDLMHRSVNTMTGQVDQMPQAILARGDAIQFENALGAGQKIRARLTVSNQTGGPADRENIVAEIRGRELPDEWVVLGASLGDPAGACNAALVVEAARDILRTGIGPRRSIRFVLFTSEQQGLLGSRAYVQAHRAELDRARAAIIFGREFAGQCVGPVTGYSLGARREVRAGVIDALKPAPTLGIESYTLDAPLGAANFDFLLEGVPTLLANRNPSGHIPGERVAIPATADQSLRELKRNTAVAAVTAFGIAEREEPLATRLSRAEIEQLLRNSGLDRQMQDAGLWPLWQSSSLGRRP